jgi:hypothetical protein
VRREDRGYPTRRSRPFVTDWHSDGRPDLLFTTRKAACPYVGTVWPVSSQPDPTPRPWPRMEASDLNGTGRPGLLLAAKLPDTQGLADQTAVWYYPRRPAPDR